MSKYDCSKCIDYVHEQRMYKLELDWVLGEINKVDIHINQAISRKGSKKELDNLNKKYCILDSILKILQCENKKEISMNNLDESDKSIINSMAENNMNISKVARELCYHRNSIVYKIDNIKEKTGYDPTNFFDLRSLVDIIRTENPNDTKN